MFQISIEICHKEEQVCYLTKMQHKTFLTFKEIGNKEKIPEPHFDDATWCRWCVDALFMKNSQAQKKLMNEQKKCKNHQNSSIEYYELVGVSSSVDKILHTNQKLFSSNSTRSLVRLTRSVLFPRFNFAHPLVQNIIWKCSD